MLKVFLILALLAAWFLPLIIAALYKLPHQGRIAVLSLLLGWTGAGWFAALIIAVGGAIRATQPASVPAGQPSGAAPGPAWRESSGVTPAGGSYQQAPGRERAPEWGQASAPGQPPAAPEWGQPGGRAGPAAPGQASPPSPPSWPGDPH